MIELSGPGAEDTTQWGIGQVTGYSIYVRASKGQPLTYVDSVSVTFYGGVHGARYRVGKIIEEQRGAGGPEVEVYVAETKIIQLTFKWYTAGPEQVGRMTSSEPNLQVPAGESHLVAGNPTTAVLTFSDGSSTTFEKMLPGSVSTSEEVKTEPESAKCRCCGSPADEPSSACMVRHEDGAWPHCSPRTQRRKA